MMQPEDRLDALLTTLLQPERAAGSSQYEQDNGSSGWRQRAPVDPVDAELAPLVNAAQDAARLAAAVPDAAFARMLRKRMLERAAELRAGGVSGSARLGSQSRPARGHRRAPLWASLAAAALLAATAGTFTAAAHAGPASPLFGLHRMEQNVQVAATRDSASRASLHIAYARQWLAALSQAASQHESGGAFQSALDAMLQEDAAAQRDASQVADGVTRTQLLTELAALQSDERAGLHAALAQVSWTDRVSATTALGQLGETIPRVTSAQASALQDGIQVSLTGSGFEPGAQLVIAGRPEGNVVTSSPTLLVVMLTSDHYGDGKPSVGVLNPDGTAAAVPQGALASLFAPGHEATQTPGRGQPQKTPGPGNHGGGTPTPGGHGDGGTGNGAPTS